MTSIKGIIAILTAILLAESSVADEKSIVVYFSRAGENYDVGDIKEGNTAKVAKVIAELTGSPTYEIKEAVPYPKNYRECVLLAKKEVNAKARPAVKEPLQDLSDYSIIFLGYPNWWGDCPMVVYTFLEKSKIDGKTILPFCTHAGSGLGATARKLATTFPKAKVEQNGFALKGIVAQKDAAKTKSEVETWLRSLGKLK